MKKNGIKANEFQSELRERKEQIMTEACNQIHEDLRSHIWDQVWSQIDRQCDRGLSVQYRRRFEKENY